MTSTICEGVAGNHHPKGIREIIDYLEYGKDCTVEEIAYLLEANRIQVVNDILLKVPDAVIEWHCFENDFESANWNVRNRKNKKDVHGHIGINERYHRVYTYPEGARIMPIFKISNT